MTTERIVLHILSFMEANGIDEVTLKVEGVLELFELDITPAVLAAVLIDLTPQFTLKGVDYYEIKYDAFQAKFQQLRRSKASLN